MFSKILEQIKEFWFLSAAALAALVFPLFAQLVPRLSIFARSKNLPPKHTWFRLVREGSGRRSAREFLFVMVGGVNGRRVLAPRLSLDFCSSQHCHSLAEIAHHQNTLTNTKYKQIQMLTMSTMPILLLQQ